MPHSQYIFKYRCKQKDHYFELIEPYHQIYRQDACAPTRYMKMTGIILSNPFSSKVVVLPERFLLALMAGISNMAYRLLAKEHGAGLVCTEMISAEGVVRNHTKTLALMATTPAERPVSIQLYGHRSDVLAEAAQIAEPGTDIIDLNFGCPARQVVRNGSGSALLKQPEVIEDIVNKVVRSVSCPVTAKIRSGWDEKSKNAPEIARIAEGGGAAAIIIHPRTKSQSFSGLSDWRIIAEVKNAVSIPVIGNGDVKSPEDVKAMMELTGCDGVMIGRGALGNPWIFSRTIRFMETGIIPPPPILEERLYHLLRFAKSLMDLKGEYIACREIRKFVKWYTKGMSQAKDLRQSAVRVESIKELEDMMMSYIESTITVKGGTEIADSKF